MNHRVLAVLSLVAACLVAPPAWSQTEAPDALVKRVSSDVLDAVKADPSIRSGDVDKVVVLANQKVLPSLDFERMTQSAVGPGWGQATPEQKQNLENEFKVLLVRVYSGALAQAADRTIQLKPMRGSVSDKEVVVRTEIRGQGQPVPMDFRVENRDGTWKIYDVNVSGVWLVDNYRNTFAQQISNGGVDSLIAALKQKNASNARR